MVVASGGRVVVARGRRVVVASGGKRATATATFMVEKVRSVLAGEKCRGPSTAQLAKYASFSAQDDGFSGGYQKQTTARAKAKYGGSSPSTTLRVRMTRCGGKRRRTSNSKDKSRSFDFGGKSAAVAQDDTS